MTGHQDNENIGILECELRGHILALELIVLALAQRVEGGDKAVAAAMRMFQRVTIDMALDEPVMELADWRAKVFEIAAHELDKIGREVVAFKKGDGVDTI
ncbi:hypothetical protein V5F32_00930 [Xanthobacter oligotrophicus]|uniref:Uncharacterized protein n=1 Tax=Xanthobacter oligotrophicus TaxID=2607286 RepID=A0ABW6ZPS5_9HYPH